MEAKLNFVVLLAILFQLSHGFRGHIDHKLPAPPGTDREEYIKFAKDYAQRYGVSFYRLYRPLDVSLDGRNKREVESKSGPSENNKGRFLGVISLPGSSGSYATSNSFYLFGKWINSAFSLSFAPAIPGHYSPPVAAIAPIRAQSELNELHLQQQQQQQQQHLGYNGGISHYPYPYPPFYNYSPYPYPTYITSEYNTYNKIKKQRKSRKNGSIDRI